MEVSRRSCVAKRVARIQQSQSVADFGEELGVVVTIPDPEMKAVDALAVREDPPREPIKNLDHPHDLRACGEPFQLKVERLRLLRTKLLADRNEHLRLLANYLNIASAGTLVTAAATAPLNAIAQDKMADWTMANLMLIFLVVSAAFHGFAQFTLTRIDR